MPAWQEPSPAAADIGLLQPIPPPQSAAATPPLFLLLYIKNDRLFMEAVIFISGSGWPARQGSLPELFAALSVGTAGYYGSIY